MVGAGAVTSLAAPNLAMAATGIDPVRRNLSGWRKQDWRDHFDTLGVGAIIADTGSRALHYWNSDASDYRVYPTSVPMSEDLTKRGYTEIVRKRVGPDWTPGYVENVIPKLNTSPGPVSAGMRCIYHGLPI
ncbi:UNVERIFIED_CONTAM: hypothetical protein GTU68_002620 [Idotea baltica]|nr:hypothetical protein [Idotea baltica]